MCSSQPEEDQRTFLIVGGGKGEVVEDVRRWGGVKEGRERVFYM